MGAAISLLPTFKYKKMADALVKDAPLKKKIGDTEKAYLEQEFDGSKKYVFQLASENMEPERPIINMRTNRAEPHKKFKPFQNLVMTSQIVWNGSRTNIRYYDGCESIFVSDQPKEKDVIDQLCVQTKKRNFLDGKLVVEGSDRQLLLYLNICSWNAESPFRTSTANQIFIPMNADKIATAETAKLDKIEEALKLAKDAKEIKMRIHASFLGIPTTDWTSGNELTEKEIRIEYRKYASKNPENFISSYGNKTLEVKFYIDEALRKGLVNNKINPNKAAWASSNSVICDISGLKTNDAISQALFEFSQTEDGSDFLLQLKAISE